MQYVSLLITTSIFIFSPVYVFATSNLDQDNLVSCRRSNDEPPNDSTSDDRSGA